MKKYIQINPADSVAVALQQLCRGELIELPGATFRLQDDIPAGHKFALRTIAEGADVYKYGAPIGHVTTDIPQGGLVNHTNLKTNLERQTSHTPTDVSSPATDRKAEPSAAALASGLPTTFLAYPRPDGQVGIRNDIWVIPTVGCVNGICRQIVERARQELLLAAPSPRTSASTPGDDSPQTNIIHFPHPYGCSQLGDDHENTRLILRDMVLHPNAGGVLVVGLGCENNQPREFEQLLGDYDRRRIRVLVCQEVEGDEIEVGVEEVKALYVQALTCEHRPVPLSELRVGLKCGGSDGFSGITANPLLGAFSDWLCTEQGGTTVLTEVPEMFGAEHLLMSRATTDDVRQQIVRLIDDFKNYFRAHGQPVGENPSPGNKAGGISTLEEKALGCTQKSGTSPVCGVLAYGQRLSQQVAATGTTSSPGKGLHLLSAPGNDLVASTALAAAGCHLVLFTTGRGTPFSTFVPTLKVSTNSLLAQRKSQWIDFDAGVLLNDVTMQDLLPRFICQVLKAVNGCPTTAERHGNQEFAIFKSGVTL